ncbi:uncharacterized protein PFL1_06363 [Pseudozyma flocculosa PF-1]|uniref:type II protein arginine methyltransferase n=1 Tax=Pseudozyma flocculosa PF-1 TaxID=1277687 RepID=A0A061H2V0_9BASI|nr:uncharacterized protein PFL1_06363 [Pseudozyma flocculosa PF-1]EPQ26155.1 hypothetical protein PFL1_06363 [Pseudozyma flocculosa PF-1]
MLRNCATRRPVLWPKQETVASRLPSSSSGTFLSSVSSANKPIARSFASSANRPSSSEPEHGDADGKDKWNRHRTQYNYDPFTLHPSSSHLGYPLVTAAELAKSSERPRGVRMLARDFIHDSLYNPHYGYFSKQAVLLPEGQNALNRASVSSSTPAGTGRGGEATEAAAPATPTAMARPERFDFGSMANESEFMRAVEKRYMDFEEKVENVVEAREREKQADAEREESERFALREREERRRRRQDQASTASPSSPTARAASYSAEGLEAAKLRGRMLARRASEGVQEKEVQTMAAKQVWHTPTQIFQPFYARAIARYLVAEYKLQLYPYDDLVVYELGAGSGALAHDVLDYLMAEEPEIYRRTRYRIVEISTRLAEEQKRRLVEHVERGTVEVVNRSFLEWNEDVPEPCFVVALEVLDNLAHDVVRYSTSTLEPFQALVSIDETGDMHELWEPVSDPLIQRYLDLLRSIYPSTSSLPLAASSSPLLRYIPSSLRSTLANHLPFYPNLTPPHYLPTGSLQMMDVLRRHFPLHRLVVSDFDSLPDACEGVDAPVVQTRFRGTMVPVTTYMVLQGYFDIFFPTDFRTLREVYNRIMLSSSAASSRQPRDDEGGLREDYFTPSCYSYYEQTRSSSAEGEGRASAAAVARGKTTSSTTAAGAHLGNVHGHGHGRKNVKLYSHAEFLERYAETDAVRLKDGSNPLLSWYANASWFLS